MNSLEEEAKLKNPKISIKQAQKRSNTATEASVRTITRTKKEAMLSPIPQPLGKCRRPKKLNVILNAEDSIFA